MNDEPTPATPPPPEPSKPNRWTRKATAAAAQRQTPRRNKGKDRNRATKQTGQDVAIHKHYRARIQAADWNVSTPADKALEQAAQAAEARLRAKGLDRDGKARK